MVTFVPKKRKLMIEVWLLRNFFDFQKSQISKKRFLGSFLLPQRGLRSSKSLLKKKIFVLRNISENHRIVPLFQLPEKGEAGLHRSTISDVPHSAARLII